MMLLEPVIADPNKLLMCFMDDDVCGGVAAANLKDDATKGDSFDYIWCRIFPKRAT
jgi:hypothetical protein